MRADIKSEVPRAKKAAIEAIQGRRSARRVIGAEAPAYGFAFHVKISAAPAAYSGGTIIPSGASRVGMPARMRRAEAAPSAVRTTIQLIQIGVPIARVELIDQNSVRMVNAHSKLGLREEPMLLMEFHGSPASVKEQAEVVQALADDMGGQAFEWATTPEARTKLWTARHNAYFAAIQSRPGCRAISTDTCVPISQLANCLLDSVKEADASGIPYFLLGHVGDGNFHFGYLINPDDPEERATAEQLNEWLVARALRLGGTCTGEHGIGLHKMDFLRAEAGDAAVDMMRAIKQALDPHNIMNPGKIFTYQG